MTTEQHTETGTRRGTSWGLTVFLIAIAVGIGLAVTGVIPPAIVGGAMRLVGLLAKLL